MAILNNSNAISSGGYDINNSLRFRSNASAASTAYLTRTPASNTNRTTWTWSGWVKRAFISSSGETTLFGAAINSGDRILISFYQDKLLMYAVSGGVTSNLSSTAVYRDPSAWYHVVVAMDTTQATASNRSRLYINGTEITSFATSTRPNQNQTFAINSTNQHQIGRNFDGTSQVNFMDGYLAEVNFVDGQALTPSSFGETDTTTGSWKPKAYTGTYGTNGFYLKFSDIATTSGSNAGLGKDFSGNANYWTTNNISVTAGTTYDAMTDSPTLTSATVSNYCVLNSANAGNQTAFTLSNANLTYSLGNLSTWTNARGTILITSGKWYWEVIPSNTQNAGIGIAKSDYPYQASYGATTTSYGLSSDGQKFVNGTLSAYSTAYAANDVIGIAFDADAGTITIYKNNTSLGVAATGISIPASGFVPMIWGGATTAQGSINFGQRPFTYTPPTGFKALNTYNLPDSTVKKGNTVMDATLYTGTRATQVVTNAGGFKPDLVWCKSRSFIAETLVSDSVRGTTKQIFTSRTDVEQTDSTMITSFNSNGFTLGDNSGGPIGNINYNIGATYVAWQWQAGQGTTSSNTDGSVASTVSVNATAGFSIVTYTGTGVTNATVGHGLGVAAKMVIVKNRTSNATSNNWWAIHANLTAGNNLYLNTTTGQFSVSGATTNGGLGSLTSTTFTLASGASNSNNTNQSGTNYVAYCWAEIEGFSKFSSYTGNGSADGVFVYTGFVPKFVLIKKTSGADNWLLYDTARDTYNVAGKYLSPNLSAAEGTDPALDMLSNGFKIRQTGGGINGSGATYIYAAFAENPFKNSNAR